MSHLSVVMLDNVDSFTYNLVDELRTMDINMVVYRNTVAAQTIYADIQAKAAAGPTLLLLSPGPGAPSEAGCMLELLEMCAGAIPVLGICLGHQAIVQFCGGDIVRADSVMHGKASYITHSNDKMFANFAQPMAVARYHSLMAENMPQELEVLASVDEIPMAVYHPKQKMLGFQFHPESILTNDGSALLKASIEYLVHQGDEHAK